MAARSSQRKAGERDPDRPGKDLVGDGLQTALERVIDLAAQLMANDHISDTRGQHDGHGDRRRGRYGEPGPEAHSGGSLRTYPTPLTVWISRGSPVASVFRRRYPT